MKKIMIITILIILIGIFGYFYFIRSKDDYVPRINVIEDVVYINTDDFFDPKNNVKYSFGKLGGKVKCNDDLKVGENIIKCNAKGNNGKSSKTSFKVIASNTYNKRAIFFGDSITYGFLTNGYSWANFIKDNYDFDIVINAGISDYRVSTYDDKNKWLVSEVNNYKNDIKYDYVILQGGVNDVLYNTPIGSISTSKNIEDFDINTFCGGLETYVATAINNYPNSKIGYIITYQTSNYVERGIKWTYEDYKKYVDITKEILDKWNIDYLDLFNDKYSEILKVDTNIYLSDNLHLNKDGYELIYPYIYDWMQDLS